MISLGFEFAKNYDRSLEEDCEPGINISKKDSSSHSSFPKIIYLREVDILWFCVSLGKWHHQGIATYQLKKGIRGMCDNIVRISWNFLIIRENSKDKSGSLYGTECRQVLSD